MTFGMQILALVLYLVYVKNTLGRSLKIKVHRGLLSHTFYIQEENDVEYEEEGEAADVFDSDFDDDVSIFYLKTCFSSKLFLFLF